MAVHLPLNPAEVRVFQAACAIHPAAGNCVAAGGAIPHYIKRVLQVNSAIVSTHQTKKHVKFSSR